MYAKPSLLVISLLLGALASDADADLSAHYCQGPSDGPVAAIIEDNVCVGYESDGKRVDFDFKGSGQLMASADGRTVVMLQSYLYGRIDEDGDIVEFAGSTDHKNPVAIFVYRDGKLVASHSIDTFIERAALVRQSVSHVRWMKDAAFTAKGDRLRVVTSSYRSIEIDVRSGQIRKAGDSADWTGCDVIASGKLDLKGSTLEKAILAKTPSASRAPLPFELDPAVARKSLTNKAWTTGCFERKAKGLVLKRLLE